MVTAIGVMILYFRSPYAQEFGLVTILASLMSFMGGIISLVN